MKFIHYIEKISGVDIMGMFSLLMFMSFFIIMTIWVLRSNKKRLDEISRIPIEN
jgi:hypothetical protein